jgi:hypothetical protein
MILPSLGNELGPTTPDLAAHLGQHLQRGGDDSCDPAWKIDPLMRVSASKIDPQRDGLIGCLLWREAGA